MTKWGLGILILGIVSLAFLALEAQPSYPGVNISGTPLAHQVAVFTSTRRIEGVTPSTAGFVFTSNGTGSDPTFQATAAQYKALRCETGLGDGLNAMTAGTYLQSMCYNDSGVTWTITGIKCFTDNSGSSTLNAAGNTLGALLTGAVTCTTAFAAGTQSANVALTNGDYIKFTFVADGTSKQTTWVVSFTQ